MGRVTGDLFFFFTQERLRLSGVWTCIWSPPVASAVDAKWWFAPRPTLLAVDGWCGGGRACTGTSRRPLRGPGATQLTGTKNYVQPKVVSGAGILSAS